MVIDECQYAPTLFCHLKVAIDAHRQQRGPFILTGSQKHTLMKYAGELQAGPIDALGQM